MIDRFFFEGPIENSIELRGDEFHHLARVMRAHIGDEVEIVDGKGSLAKARIEKIEKETAHLKILQRESHPKPAPSIFLGIPLLRIDRLEWAIEKGTELGAEAFRLFAADYSEKDDLSLNQIERLRRISIAAMKQCGRLYLPEIALFASLEKALLPDAEVLFGDIESNEPLILPTRARVLFFSGPEKGFSESEELFLHQVGRGVRLHANILRAETAPLAALAQLTMRMK
jgi:16S rRNA (uracil1498-N3)-methyltransferase